MRSTEEILEQLNQEKNKLGKVRDALQSLQLEVDALEESARCGRELLRDAIDVIREQV
jgi:hypothetical protein